MLCRVLWNLLSQCSCVFFIPLVLSNSTLPGLKQSMLSKLDVGGQWKSAIFKQRIKENILQSLNITNPPFILTPRTLATTSRNKIFKVDHVSTDRLRNVTLILSDATEPYRRDAMVFKIHSKVRSQLSHIETPLIILRLKLSSKRSSRSKFKKEKKSPMRRKVYENLSVNKQINGNNKDTSNSSTVLNSTDISNEVPKLLNVTRIHARHSKRKRRTQRIMRRLRRSKARKVRVIVRAIDPVTNKRRRIFVGKILVKKSIKIMTVPVPKHIFKAAAESESHSLLIQVSCRNCKRYVKMDRVYRKGKKRQSANSHRLNPNRPYLYVNAVDDNKDENKRRSRRHLSKNVQTNSEHPLKNYMANANEYRQSDIQCKEKLNYYSFEELGLGGVILYPVGFYTYDCLGECHASEHTLPVSKQYTRKTFKLESNSSKSERHQGCISTSKSSLDILYFVNSHAIIPTRLVNFIGESCGCSSV